VLLRQTPKRHPFAPNVKRLYTGHTDIVTSVAVIDENRFVSGSATGR